MSEPMTKRQTTELLNHLAGHSMTAAGQMMGNNAKFTKLEQWSRVADIVSPHGQKKNAKQCEDHWKYLKGQAKKYNAQKNTFYNRNTGNNCDEGFQLNDEYEQVLQIVGNSHKNGLHFGTELGIRATAHSAKSLSGNRKRKNRVVYVVPDGEEDSIVEMHSCKRKQARTPASHCKSDSQASNDSSLHNAFETTDSVPANNHDIDVTSKPSPASSHVLQKSSNPAKENVPKDTFNRPPLGIINSNVQKAATSSRLNTNMAETPTPNLLHGSEGSVVAGTSGSTNANYFQQLAMHPKVSVIHKDKFELNMEKSMQYSAYNATWKTKNKSYSQALQMIGEQNNAIHRLASQVETLATEQKLHHQFIQEYYRKKEQDRNKNQM